MKRMSVIGLLVAIAMVVAIGGSLLVGPARRPRPEGFRAAWDALPLVKESEWAVDELKRGVVQAEFFLSTEGLTRCVQEHGGSGASVNLELLVETEHGRTYFEFVDAEPRIDLPEGLVACVTASLEAADPVPTPGLAEGTRWRLAYSFLVPPLSELPKVQWWQRLIPEKWRSGRSQSAVG